MKERERVKSRRRKTGCVVSFVIHERLDKTVEEAVEDYNSWTTTRVTWGSFWTRMKATERFRQNDKRKEVEGELLDSAPKTASSSTENDVSSRFSCNLYSFLSSSFRSLGSLWWWSVKFTATAAPTVCVHTRIESHTFASLLFPLTWKRRLSQRNSKKSREWETKK